MCPMTLNMVGEFTTESVVSLYAKNNVVELTTEDHIPSYLRRIFNTKSVVSGPIAINFFRHFCLRENFKNWLQI